MTRSAAPAPAFHLKSPDTRVYVGDSRELLASVPECKAGEIDLIYADPPFNWKRDYDRHVEDSPHSGTDNTVWDDAIPDDDYLKFTYDWLDGCIKALKPQGTLWVNIPDDWAAEICVHLKQRRLHMVNWCIWHYRFGQNRLEKFINSKVHVFYFCKDPFKRTWNVKPILEPSDRATTYADKRTYNKKEGESGLRVPMDVWYGKNWGRIQGNNNERRPGHDNQIPEVYLERVIRACSNEDDLVLDPFLGSGTTCTVARELRRRSIGFEYSKANAASAFERIGKGPYRIKYAEPTLHVNPIFQKRNLTQPTAARGAEEDGLF
jgi:site-specific DNA-methyltransferase (adenine-specific)